MEFHSPPTSFDRVVSAIAGIMLHSGESVDTGHWQSLPDVAQTRTIELRNVAIDYQIPDSESQLAEEVNPNLPWAELQFKERIGGEPLNPGRTYHLWPYYHGNVPKHQDPNDGDKFSHTYMERFWPRHAGTPGFRDEDGVWHEGPTEEDNIGIRYRYGDLEDLLTMLDSFPYTRQAYLPIFFPEDTGAVYDQRIPCTLGYHFMLRAGRLQCFYPIRSCDLLRHMRDDVYMAARLVQWILGELKNEEWKGVKPGRLWFQAHSLHVFEPERPILLRMSDEEIGGAAV